jgi:hypothetical protein
VLIGFALEAKGRERRGPRDEEARMPMNPQPDECARRELEGGRP